MIDYQELQELAQKFDRPLPVCGEVWEHYKEKPVDSEKSNKYLFITFDDFIIESSGNVSIKPQVFCIYTDVNNIKSLPFQYNSFLATHVDTNQDFLVCINTDVNFPGKENISDSNLPWFPDFKIWARDLEDFMGVLPEEKQAESGKLYRFTKTEMQLNKIKSA
jgi:hypothetical protein